MIGRLSRYLFIQSLIGILGAATVVLAVIILVDFVETSRDIATRADISMFQALELTILKTPLLLQETLAFIVLFGVLFTYFRLSRRSELIVMRASGYSAWRILAPAGVLTLSLGLFSAAILNPIGALSNARFESLRDELLQGRTGQPSGGSGRMWLRETTSDGFILITADNVDPDTSSLENPLFRVYRLTDNGAPELERRYSASMAQLNGGFWTLQDAQERQAGEAVTLLGAVSLPTLTQRQALFERVRSPDATAFWALPGVINSARAAGLSDRAYRLQWQGLLAQPLILFAAALMAMAATLRLHRLGGAAGFAVAGSLGGFLLYFFQELLLGLGASGALDPVTAAWTTPIVFALAGLFFIASTEDG